MSTLYYNDYYILLPFLWFFTMNWIFFFKTNFFTIRVPNVKHDIYNQNNVNKKMHFSIFISWILINLGCLIFVLFFKKGVASSFFWNHLLINNLIFFLILFVLFLNFLFFLIVFFLRFSKINYSNDFFFALINLNTFLPFLFLSNTLFTFFFVLEVNSTIVFYKFIVSKVWYKTNTNNYKTELDHLDKTTPKNYLNVLFFQYWATFFSSVLFLFFLINIIYLFGSTEFFFLNFLINFESLLSLNANNIYLTILLTIFLLSFFIKIGFAPFQLFKIEVYKGIPFLSIFFYTTFYFLVYFIYFGLMIFVYLHNFNIYFYYVLLAFIFFGGLFIISLLFDVNYIKAFFAYSSLINSILFLSILITGFSF